MEDVIKTAVADVLAELAIEVGDFAVEHPGDMSHGDYACNVAMVAAKGAGMVPRALAEKIVAALTDQIEYVEKIEIAGPGFINFYLARDFFTAELFRARELGADWGRNEREAGRKIVVEYTDPNPFKAFHIGHLFTNTVGEAIARLGELQGADIRRANYQGDVGLHVAHAVYGMQQLGIMADSQFTAADLGRAYALGATAYRDDEAAQPIIRELNKKIYERSDAVVNALYDAGRAVSLAYFESIYAIVGTKFSEYFFESEMAPKGKALVLAHPEVFPQSDGAYIFRGEDYGLHTRVFLNKEGLPTYEAKELALAKAKDERLGGYDHSIISTAKEINEYFKVLKKAMSFVYPELAAKTEHIGHGMVRLTTGKMSSRTGDVILATDFIDDIAAAAHDKIVETGMATPTPELARAIALGAIKYTTLKSDVTQDSIFDTNKALSFEGDSGPYLQYTHARIKSVLDKAATAGVVPSLKVAPEVPYVVERSLYQFEEVVATAWETRAPHLLVTYLTELAGAFNSFYAHEKIADASDKYASYKAAVAEAVATTLRNGLWALGIEAPERL
jgi:arginyl-tRNA synthetase